MFRCELLLNSKVFRATLKSVVLLFFWVQASAFNEERAPLPAHEQARELQGIGIEEKLGGKLDLSILVTDESGAKVSLSSFFDGKHPVILSPVYFSCPGLCNFHLNGLTDAFKLMPADWAIGKRYQILSISFDSKENSELAAKKKVSYLKQYGKAGAEGAWHFLTAEEASVQAITQQLGFKFKWDEANKEWAHASAAVILTPDGTISRYLPGVAFDPKDIKLALNEATQGKIGSFVEHLVLYCFKYDPKQSKYTLAAYNVMKLGGAVMVLGMIIWLMLTYIRSFRAKREEAGR